MKLPCLATAPGRYCRNGVNGGWDRQTGGDTPTRAWGNLEKVGSLIPSQPWETVFIWTLAKFSFWWITLAREERSLFHRGETPPRPQCKGPLSRSRHLNHVWSLFSYQSPRGGQLGRKEERLWYTWMTRHSFLTCMEGEHWWDHDMSSKLTLRNSCCAEGLSFCLFLSHLPSFSSLTPFILSALSF